MNLSQNFDFFELWLMFFYISVFKGCLKRMSWGYYALCVPTARYLSALSLKGAVWGDSHPTIMRAESTLLFCVVACFQHVLFA